MRNHQDIAGRGVGRNAGHEPGRIEFGLKIQPFFAIMIMC
jgi:hypothetical protein